MNDQELQEYYQRQLTKMLEPGRTPQMKRKTVRQMLSYMKRTEGGTYTETPGARTWLWSDLHLHHGNIIRYCKRPFTSVEAMDAALLDAWRDSVDESDTMICGGDVARAKALNPERIATLRQLPGRKLLVLGNHDLTKRGRIVENGSDERWMTLLIPGKPTLAVTHVPMSEVPDGTVNLHGHVHNNVPLLQGPYINICVEHTGYRPLPINDVRTLANARLLNPEPRASTTADEIESLRCSASE